MNFLLNCTRTEHPDESTSRQMCLPKCYEEALNKIRILCGNKESSAYKQSIQYEWE
jgi:hypothetical protein